MASPEFRNYASSLDPFQGPGASNVAKQIVSEVKYDTVALAAAAVPAQTAAFAQNSADLALKNFDGNQILVNSGKAFLIKNISINVRGTVIADIDAVINQLSCRIQVDQKVYGTIPLSRLCAAGGTFVAGAQVAAASGVGITNGNPLNQPFRLEVPIMVEGLKTFYFFILGPTGTPLTLTSIVTLRIQLEGKQAQAIQ